MHEDLELLGAVLHRYLTDPIYRSFFYISDNELTLDGAIAIWPDEAKALLRTTAGRIDGPGLRHADPATYAQ